MSNPARGANSTKALGLYSSSGSSTRVLISCSLTCRGPNAGARPDRFPALAFVRPNLPRGARSSSGACLLLRVSGSISLGPRPQNEAAPTGRKTSPRPSLHHREATGEGGLTLVLGKVGVDRGDVQTDLRV